MACLWKRENSPYWFCCYTTRDGRRLKKSTKIRIRSLPGQKKSASQLKEEALKVCMEVAGLERETGNIEIQARKLVTEAVQRATGKKLHFYTPREWVNSWLRERTGNVASGTLVKYKGHLNEFLQMLQEKADAPLGHISKEDIMAFRELLNTRGLAPASVRVALKAIKMPFAAAKREALIDIDPSAAVTTGRIKRKTEKGRKDYFRPDQIEKLMEVTRGTNWEGMILLASTHGFRIGDCLSLEWGDVDLIRGIWGDKFAEKTGFDHTAFPIHPAFLKWLKGQQQGIGKVRVFSELSKARVGGKHGASLRFRKIMENAGIKPRMLKKGEKDGRTVWSLGFHSLRHSAASLLKQAGVSDIDIRKITGHASSEMLAIYTHEEESHWRKILSKNRVASS